MKALGYREDDQSPAGGGQAKGMVPGVFRLPAPDAEPLPRVTRTALEWDGAYDYREIDPATGATVALGSVAELVRLTHSDREELRL